MECPCLDEVEVPNVLYFGFLAKAKERKENDGTDGYQVPYKQVVIPESLRSQVFGDLVDMKPVGMDILPRDLRSDASRNVINKKKDYHPCAY